MADNVTLNAGSGGATVAADEIGGVMFPRTKLVIGADGTNGGDVSSANPLPCTISGVATAANQSTANDALSAIQTAVETLDNAVAGNELQVDVVSMPETTVNLGATDNAVLDSIAAAAVAIQAAVETLDNVVAGNEAQVDIVSGSVTANAGTNLNTSALALESGGNLASAVSLLGTIDADTSALAGCVGGNELQVDVVSLPSITGTVDLGATDNAILDAIATFTEATATFTQAIKNAVEGTLAVSGTVDLGATDNAVLDSIAAALAGTLTVDSHPVTNTGTFAVQVSSALPAGTNAIGKLAANSGVDIGDVDVTSIAAGSNLIGDVGLSGARTSGGTTPYKNLDVDESEDQVKGTAGQIYWIHAINLADAKRYLKFYNDTPANVTVGTTTPVLTLPLPTQGDTNGAGFTLSIPNGIAFSTAITIAATTGLADNDTGAPGANEVIVNLGYA